MSPRRSIAWKLLASYGLVIVVAVATHLLVTYPLAAGHVTAYAHRAAMGAAVPDHLQGILLRSLLWAGLPAVAVAAGLALLLARGIIRPIQRMVEATRRVAGGDYKVR